MVIGLVIARIPAGHALYESHSRPNDGDKGWALIAYIICTVVWPVVFIVGGWVRHCEKIVVTPPKQRELEKKRDLRELEDD